MSTIDYAVGVTGMNATDNPGPGITVSRALRLDPEFKGRIIGLAYDSLDPGIYASDVVDDVFLIPYPSQGVDALKERLAYVGQRTGMRVVIPTLDAELPSFMALEDTLDELGIGTFLCTRQQYDLRSKVKLVEMGEKAGIDVPKSKVISDSSSLYSIHEDVPYPFFVKGLFYGAYLARSVDEAVVAFHQTVAKWGVPVIIQQFVGGEELNVVAVGDGEGGLVGAVIWFAKSKGEMFEFLKLRVPLVGKIIAMAAISRLAKTLSILLEAGFSTPDALELARDTVNNKIIAGVVDEARQRAEAGSSFAEPFGRHWVVPEMTADIMAIGEETGNLPKLLGHLAKLFEVRVNTAADRLITILEPVLTLVVASSTLVVALAMFLPYFSLFTQGIGGG